MPFSYLDSTSGEPILVAPSGHIADICACTDRDRGVHKAPGNETVAGLVADENSNATGPPEYRLDCRDEELFNARGVNMMRDVRLEGEGFVMLGARTLA